MTLARKSKPLDNGGVPPDVLAAANAAPAPAPEPIGIASDVPDLSAGAPRENAQVLPSAWADSSPDGMPWEVKKAVDLPGQPEAGDAPSLPSSIPMDIDQRIADLNDVMNTATDITPHPDVKRKLSWEERLNPIFELVGGIGRALAVAGGRDDVAQLDLQNKRFQYEKQQDALNRQRQDVASKATVLGETEQGGQLPGYGTVPGVKRKLEMQEEAKGVAESRMIERKIKSAQAQIEGLGYLKGTPEYTAALKESLGLPDMIDAGQFDPRLKGKMVKSSDALSAIMRRETNQTKIDIAGLQGGRANTARSDKSFQYNNTALDKLSKPIEDQTQRIGRLIESIKAKTPLADSLLAPELLTVMAGGQGSGLRMTEAEISRIVGGRSNWESMKAALNKWRLDPSKALSVTPAQRAQMNQLITKVYEKLVKKQDVLENARDSMLDSDDPRDHRRIVNEARRKLLDMDMEHAENTNNPNAPKPPVPGATLVRRP